MQVLTEFEQLLYKLRDLRACVRDQVPKAEQNMYMQQVMHEAGRLLELYSGLRANNCQVEGLSWACKDPTCTAMHVILELKGKLGNLEVGPIPLYLTCPACGARHVDEGEFATKPHHTHACQECGLTWRPAVQATVGVRFLPGFKNKDNKQRTVTFGPPPTEP